MALLRAKGQNKADFCPRQYGGIRARLVAHGNTLQSADAPDELAVEAQHKAEPSVTSNAYQLPETPATVLFHMGAATCSWLADWPILMGPGRPTDTDGSLSRSR